MDETEAPEQDRANDEPPNCLGAFYILQKSLYAFTSSYLQIKGFFGMMEENIR